MSEYVWHAHEGEYPINDNQQPLIQVDYVKPYPYTIYRCDDTLDGYPHTYIQNSAKSIQSDYVRPFPMSLWRCDEGNGGYPYTELQLGVVGAPPPPPPPPPPTPEYETVTILQYDIYCDGKLMHSSVVPTKNYKLIDPVLDLQDSAAGSLEFTLPPFNNLYGKCQMMMSTISVRRNGVEIWEGRPVSFKEDMWKNHPTVCEGELAYLNDIYQPQMKYENVTLQQLLYAILGTDENGQAVTSNGGYNARAAENRRFSVRTVESSKYQSDLLDVTIPFQTTLETINNICKTYGLHVYIDNVWTDGVKDRGLRFESDGLGQNKSQTIEFGRNLVEYSKSYNFSEIVTYVLPLGAKSNKAGATVKDNDETIDVKAAGLEQGTITSSGNVDNPQRVRSKVYLPMPTGSDSMTITALSGETALKFALIVYNSAKEIIYDSTDVGNVGHWSTSGDTIDTSGIIGGAYYRLVLAFSNDADITPSDISSCTDKIIKTRKGTPVGTNYGRGYVIWPSNKKDSAGNTHDAGDIVSLSGITDYGSTDNERNRYFVEEYVITEQTSTVFITTMMNKGAGMAVVHNGDNHYYIKKAGNSSVFTAWTEMKFSGWYSGFTGTTKLYVAGYDDEATGSSTPITSGKQVVINSKVVDKGLEEYVTVEGISTNPDQSLDNVVGKYVRDTDTTQYDDGVLPTSIYGRIERKVEWPDATDGATLYNNAIQYLRSGQFDGLQIELTALDMAMLGFNATQLKVGETVRCKCSVYGLDKTMPVTSIKIPLTRPDEAKYTVGSGNKQTLTSVNNATNSEILSLIAEKPSMSAVMSVAKSSAAQYIMDTNNGYVTMRYAEDGHPEAIIISDTEDYLSSPTGYWLFGKHGLGFIEAGGAPEEEQAQTNVAIKNTGEIVADRILTGTMVADRILGGTMRIGYWLNSAGQYMDGNIELKDSNGNVMGIIDNEGFTQLMWDFNSDNDTWYKSDWIKMYNGKVAFGSEYDSNGKPTGGMFIKGNGAIESGYDAIEIYGGTPGDPSRTTIFGIATREILVWDFDADAYATGQTTTSVYAGNKELHFINGILTYCESSSQQLYNSTFKDGDGNTVHVSNGVITQVTSPSNA